MIYAFIALFIAAAGFGAGWMTNGWRHDSQQLAIQSAVDAAKEAFGEENNKLGERLEGKLANLKIVNKTVNRQVEVEIREKAVYLDANCAVPESGVQLLNRARGYGPAATPSKPAADVPAAAEDRAKDAPPR